jgi:hypothetical protein
MVPGKNLPKPSTHDKTQSFVSFSEKRVILLTDQEHKEVNTIYGNQTGKGI